MDAIKDEKMHSNVEILSATPEAYQKAPQAIRDGKIVVMPTLTIYVLVCDAFNETALKKLRAVRNSPADKPITIVMDKLKIPEYAIVDERQKEIIDIFSPSPVSMYVQKKKKRRLMPQPPNRMRSWFIFRTAPYVIYTNVMAIFWLSAHPIYGPCKLHVRLKNPLHILAIQ
jgi:tRNA A37 threonylcarbamoyladenosine synthetase subunit TsaC/SUA5/YrdC